MRRTTAAVALTGAVFVAGGLVAGPAAADPPSVPSDSTVVAVGAETSQLVTDALASQYNDGSGFASWDATPPGTTITTKTGCATINRPNGTTAGITALGANSRPTGDATDYCIDIARSARPPASTDPTGLAFVPFADDAVTWTAAKRGNAPTTLTVTQLKAIYSCDASILGNGGSGPVTWNEVGGTSTDAAYPIVPPSTSGIRSAFLTDIGVTTLGGCVDNDGTVEQNEGTNAVFTGTHGKDAVFPYSVAVDLSQTLHGHSTSTDNPGPLTLRKVGGVSPTSGKSPNTTINKRFTFLLPLFYVVRSTGKAAKYVPTYLQPLLGANNGTGFVCSSDSASTLVSYGLITLGTKCGKISLTT